MAWAVCYNVSQLIDPSNQQDLSVGEKFRTQNTSKAITYRSINPELTVHKAYTAKEYIDERERLSFTRFRLSSHHLKIETGRWARIEAENRVCDCGGGIQDEHHVLLFTETLISEAIKPEMTPNQSDMLVVKPNRKFWKFIEHRDHRK